MLSACVLDFGGSWDVHLPLVEFLYNNSYHSSVRCAPVEAFYNRKCRSPILWAEVGEGQLIGPKIVYADKRRKPLEFSVGDHVLPKVSLGKVKRILLDVKLAGLLADLRSSSEDLFFGDCIIGFIQGMPNDCPNVGVRTWREIDINVLCNVMLDREPSYRFLSSSLPRCSMSALDLPPWVDPDPITRISNLDVSDPLHLHPNDTTALSVVSIKLKGTENYQWDKVNAIVLGWILNSISEELFLGQIFSKRAKHVWEELKETYDKYDAMIELPKCVCNASESFKKHHQLLKLMQFLMGLDNYYMQIRSFILCREVLPDVRSAYATISSEKSHRVAAGSIAGSSQRNQASAFVSNVPNRNNLQRNQASGFIKINWVSGFSQNLNSGSRLNNMNNNRQGGGSGLVCENCGFKGHTIDRCFKIIGYPADFGKKKSNQSFKGKNVSNNNSVGTSFLDSEIEKNDSTNVLQDVNHINFFDIEYPEIPNDDERVENDLNRDKRTQSDSSSSSVSCSNHKTIDFHLTTLEMMLIAVLEENMFLR
ncbi:ribonuclease H-like domain-containing protein, partial [Tanacetum coccineum]